MDLWTTGTPLWIIYGQPMERSLTASCQQPSHSLPTDYPHLRKPASCPQTHSPDDYIGIPPILSICLKYQLEKPCIYSRAIPILITTNYRFILSQGQYYKYTPAAFAKSFFLPISSVCSSFDKLSNTP